MAHLLKNIAKKIAWIIFGDYSLFFIYTNPPRTGNTPTIEKSNNFGFKLIDKTSVASSRDPLIQEQADYGGEESYIYAGIHEKRIVCVCIYWYGERYKKRDFWPLKKNEAKLVQIITLPEIRGHGAAAKLITYSYSDMIKRGFQRLYARIWHSNTPSVRAFQKAGWERLALVIEINPFRRPNSIRIRFNL